MSRESNNLIKVYSTKDSQHHESLVALYEQITGKNIESNQTLRSIIKDIVDQFGYQFQCCKNNKSLIIKCINMCKKAEEELENAAQRQKISNYHKEKNNSDDGPTDVEEDFIQNKNMLQRMKN